MPKSKHPNADFVKQERTERVLDVLDSAVTTELDLDTPARPSTLPEGLEALPKRLKDPFAVLERGRALLRTGLPVRDARINADFDDELRMAARNGKPIPDDIRQRMNEERARSEQTPSPKSPAASPLPQGLSNGQSRTTVSTAVTPLPVRREEEIEELAALLVAQSSTKDRVDLESIAAKERITFSFGHYRDCFDGLLECRNSTFPTSTWTRTKARTLQELASASPMSSGITFWTGTGQPLIEASRHTVPRRILNRET